MGVQASSVLSGYGASKLIDGLNLDTWSTAGCAHTQNGLLEWFSLELDMPKTVTRVQIAVRWECCPERVQNVSITIGPSKIFDPNEPLCRPVADLKHETGLKDYICTSLHTGKFVKISRSGSLNLCEIKVFTIPGKLD